MGADSVDLGLVLLRLVIAAILFAHGTQKLLGWFSGQGLAGSAVLFEKLGQRPGRTMVLMASACELTACLLLGLGVLTPLGAAVGMGAMLVAGASLSGLSKKFWNAIGGGEYPFVLAAALAVVAFTGPGEISLDAWFGAPWYGVDSGQAILVGAGAVVVAVIAALPPLLNGRRNLARASS
jgi:putative oxidoreductase